MVRMRYCTNSKSSMTNKEEEVDFTLTFVPVQIIEYEQDAEARDKENYLLFYCELIDSRVKVNVL
jgi:hypothetical protein